MTTTAPDRIDHVQGDATGLTIPAHSEALRAMGEDFLTQAFRAFGSIGSDNAVARIASIKPCGGGSTGDKLFLTIEYAKPSPDLHTELFVKFSRDFTDTMRDHQKTEMEPEARFAAISRLPSFPISTPAAYFADYEAMTGTGIVITQRVPFGEGTVEKQHLKCLDHLLDDPLPYYRALITALARLAAAHKAGRLAPDIEARFPYDPVAASSDPIHHDEASIRKALSFYADFAARCPQLMPEELHTPDFLAQMERDALHIRAHEAAIQEFLRGDYDLIALCHWNAHIDNAWFWRDDAGELQCGLIDWGRVSQITFGSALWGCLSAAHHDIWRDHLDELLALFAAEYHAQGGPKISVEKLELHLLLHIASMGVARCLVFPRIVLMRLPEAEHASGPRDPVFLKSDPARNCLHIYTALLNLWRRRDFGACVDRLLAQQS